MKGATLYAAGGAVALLLVLIYLFSFPVVTLAVAKSRATFAAPTVTRFYAPAMVLARHCPPYQAVLAYEKKLLGIPSVRVNARRGQITTRRP